MEPKWFTAKTYICEQCKAARDVVQVLEEITISDTANPSGTIKLSCGHTQKMIRITKTVSIGSLFRNSKVSVKTIGETSIPVSVSGETGVTKIASLSGFQGFVSNAGQLTVDTLTVNNYVQITSSTSTVYNIHDIFTQIDNSTYSSEQKDKVKEIIKTINDEINTKPFPQIIGSLSSKLKTYLPLATPFIIPFLNSLITGG